MEKVTQIPIEGQVYKRAGRQPELCRTFSVMGRKGLELFSRKIKKGDQWGIWVPHSVRGMPLAQVLNLDPRIGSQDPEPQSQD